MYSRDSLGDFYKVLNMIEDTTLPHNAKIFVRGLLWEHPRFATLRNRAAKVRSEIDSLRAELDRLGVTE